MAGYQDVADGIAKVVGGSQPDATNRPRFFSGAQVGDGTGVSGIDFAWSAPPEQIQDAPMAIVLPSSFSVTREPLTQGQEDNADDFKLLILANRAAPTDIWATLTAFRDTVPAAFRAHMTLFSTANVLQAYVKAGKGPGHVEWGGQTYLGWDFTIRVLRVLPVSYVL
jgi:hypothetical protein